MSFVNRAAFTAAVLLALSLSSHSAFASMSSGDRQQMRESMRKQAADIRTILTPDQQTQFDQNLANMRSRMRSH